MTHLVRALPVLAVLGAGSLGAQTPDRTIKVSVGGGPMVVDHGEGGVGVSAFFRFSSLRLPLLLDASVLSAPGTPVVAILCPVSGPCGGGLPYGGPTTALTLAPALQLTERGHKAALLYRVGPSLSWLADREPGTQAVTAGVRAGVSLRVGEGNSGLLLSGDYFRLLRGSTAPRWFLPITIGWQF